MKGCLPFVGKWGDRWTKERHRCHWRHGPGRSQGPVGMVTYLLNLQLFFPLCQNILSLRPELFYGVSSQIWASTFISVDFVLLPFDIRWTKWTHSSVVILQNSLETSVWRRTVEVSERVRTFSPMCSFHMLCVHMLSHMRPLSILLPPQ